MRFMLPAWLGTGKALMDVTEQGQQVLLQEMQKKLDLLPYVNGHAGNGSRQS